MGYMGFGMNKEAYTRKPRKIFSHLKRINGGDIDDHFNRKHIEAGQGKTFTEEEWKAFRTELQLKAKKENRKRMGTMGASLILTVVVLAVLAWLVKYVLG